MRRSCDRASMTFASRYHGRSTTAHAVAVIDLDSPRPARFDAEDQAGFEALAALAAARV